MADAPALDLHWRSGSDAAELCDLLYAALDDFDPLAIHEHASADGWRVFFRSVAQRDLAAVSLASAFEGSLTSIGSADVPDEDWARRSQADLGAIRVGRILVTPPWDKTAQVGAPAGISNSDHVIVIDPSTGFGTGHHETTRLCLALLQEIAVEGARAIDVGTGSGVLAIAAAKLGATSVLAFDEDPEALRNTVENVTRNGVTHVVDVQLADLASFTAPPANIVTANLTGAVLERYAERLLSLLEPDGALIVSGFNGSEAGEVTGALGIPVAREMHEGDWAAALLRITRDPSRS